MEKILVTRSSMPSLDEYVDEIRELFDSHWLTNMGVKHETFRSELKQYLGVEGVELLTNGHMALEMAVQAFNFEPHSEVITTPFTFASTTHAIVRNNLVPVFCDIDPVTFTIDTNQIETLITDRTVAIMPVHVYGIICNIEEIDRIAKKHNLVVIYDAAHTFGETYNGQGIGSFGDVSCFSFHATKVFNSIEGGAVCYKDENIGKAIYKLKNFGIKNEEIVDGVGANAKMNEFCAAMGICNLRHIEDEIEKRRKLVERYRSKLDSVDGIQLAPMQQGVKSNYSYFPVVINDELFGENRDYIYDELKSQGIFARKYFYPLTSDFDCFNGMFADYELTTAKYVSKRVLTLPIYADLEIETVDMICDSIKKMKKDM